VKISLSDGSISFAAGTIERHVDREAFLATDLGRSGKAELVNEDWRRVGVRPEPGIAATLLYNGDHLHQVWLLMAIPADETEEWTMDNEMKRKAVHDAWLQSEIGKPPYKYAWGKIDSEFDAKGCVSEIIITYAD
jgi:hypothetical protein